jgi:hypothetical protein
LAVMSPLSASTIARSTARRRPSPPSRLGSAAGSPLVAECPDRPARCHRRAMNSQKRIMPPGQVEHLARRALLRSPGPTHRASRPRCPLHPVAHDRRDVGRHRRQVRRRPEFYTPCAVLDPRPQGRERPDSLARRHRGATDPQKRMMPPGRVKYLVRPAQPRRTGNASEQPVSGGDFSQVGKT